MSQDHTFRVLHNIERDPRWPHADGCEGDLGCMGCHLEDAVLQAGGKQGREFLLKHMNAPAPQAPKGKRK